jgi:hypothetical protein
VAMAFFVVCLRVSKKIGILCVQVQHVIESYTLLCRYAMALTAPFSRSASEKKKKKIEKDEVEVEEKDRCGNWEQNVLFSVGSYAVGCAPKGKAPLAFLHPVWFSSKPCLCSKKSGNHWIQDGMAACIWQLTSIQ